jgi:hypothetical protein
MDTHLPAPGDLNDLERRLSAMRPSTEGLDAGKMLFAAGRASVRPGWGRIAWPVVSACLVFLVATLGVGFAQERAARLELDAQLNRMRPAVVPAPSVEPDSAEFPSSDSPLANSYLAARRTMLLDMDAGPVLAQVRPAEGPSMPSPAILKANSHDDLLDP